LVSLLHATPASPSRPIQQRIDPRAELSSRKDKDAIVRATDANFEADDDAFPHIRMILAETAQILEVVAVTFVYAFASINKGSAARPKTMLREAGDVASACGSSRGR
jgi:hypothetical protein